MQRSATRYLGKPRRAMVGLASACEAIVNEVGLSDVRGGIADLVKSKEEAMVGHDDYVKDEEIAQIKQEGGLEIVLKHNCWN